MIWLEHKLLCYLIFLLFNRTAFFILIIGKEISNNVKLIVKTSFYDPRSLAHEILEILLLHFSLSLFLIHNLKGFHQLFLLSFLLLFFSLWHWVYYALSNKASSDKATFLCSSSHVFVWAVHRAHSQLHHLFVILRHFVFVLFLLFYCLKVLYHWIINNCALDFTVINNSFFL